jgi:HD superfamily phosphodiesterase
MTDSVQVETIYKLAEPFWQTRSGEIHMPQAFEFAKRLLEFYPLADAEIVLPTILLHDIGYARVPEETHHQGLAGAPKGWQPEVTRLHEIEGVKMAREMLTSLGFDALKLEKILEIIDGHDSRKQAVSLEDAIVKDADKLWRFGLEGVTICRGWMGMSATDFMAYVEAKITEWFLTDHGAELARETLSQTRTKLKENS